MINSTQEVFFIYSADRSQLLYVSPSYEQVWGRSSKSLYQDPTSWLEALHPEDRAQVQTSLEQQLPETPYAQEYRIIQPGGAIRWISARSSLIYDRAGTLNRIAVFAEDITDCKHSARRDDEIKFRMFLEAASEAVIVSKANGEITLFNSKAEELFGYSQAEMLGRSVECLMPERFRQGHIRFRQGYYGQPGKRSMGQARNLFALRKDGSEFPIEAGLSSVQIDNERFVLTFLTDISDRKQAEEALRQSEATLRQTEESLRQVNQELEQRVALRTAELSQLNDCLQQELLERERSQPILQEQAQLLDLAHDTIIARDLDGVITFWNRGAEEMYGWTSDEAIGNISHDLLRTQFTNSVSLA